MTACGDRWTDPLAGRSETLLGPFVCRRRADHGGAHAWEGGDGAFAAWMPDGQLVLAAQQVARAMIEEMTEEQGWAEP